LLNLICFLSTCFNVLLSNFQTSTNVLLVSTFCFQLQTSTKVLLTVTVLLKLCCKLLCIVGLYGLDDMPDLEEQDAAPPETPDMNGGGGPGGGGPSPKIEEVD
jgi:hypothetical protein